MNEQEKDNPGKESQYVQSYAPLFQIPDANTADKIARYKHAVNGRHKYAQLFNGRRKHLQKSEYHGNVTDDADERYDFRPFHVLV